MEALGSDALNLGYLLRGFLGIPKVSGKPKKVLEIGCGNGALSAELGKLGYAVVAIDNNASLIERAHQKHANMENVSFLAADLDQFGLGPTTGQFSYIVAAFAVHHAEDIETSLTNLRSMLITGGEFVLLDLYAEHRESLFCYLFDQLVYSHWLVLSCLFKSVWTIGVFAMLRFLLGRLLFGISAAGQQHITEDRARDRPPTLAEWRQILGRQGAVPSIVCGSVFIARINDTSAK
jgi:SAM-dependent methyltransferase